MQKNEVGMMGLGIYIKRRNATEIKNEKDRRISEVLHNFKLPRRIRQSQVAEIVRAVKRHGMTEELKRAVERDGRGWKQELVRELTGKNISETIRRREPKYENLTSDTVLPYSEQQRIKTLLANGKPEEMDGKPKKTEQPQQAVVAAPSHPVKAAQEEEPYEMKVELESDEKQSIAGALRGSYTDHMRFAVFGTYGSVSLKSGRSAAVVEYLQDRNRNSTSEKVKTNAKLLLAEIGAL